MLFSRINALSAVDRPSASWRGGLFDIETADRTRSQLTDYVSHRFAGMPARPALRQQINTCARAVAYAGTVISTTSFGLTLAQNLYGEHATADAVLHPESPVPQSLVFIGGLVAIAGLGVESLTEAQPARRRRSRTVPATPQSTPWVTPSNTPPTRRRMALPADS